MRKLSKYLGLASAFVLAITSMPVHAETWQADVIAEVDGNYIVIIPKVIKLTLQEDGSHSGGLYR